MAQHIAVLVLDDEQVKRLSVKGLHRAKDFGWEKTLSKAVDVCRALTQYH